MRRPLIALLATSISFAPGMAAGANSSSGTVRAPLSGLRLPATALIATGSGENLQVEAPGTRLEDALRATIDPTDVRTQMDAVRLLIQGDTGLQLPDLRPAHTRAPSSAFNVFPRQSGTLEDPVPEPEPEPEPTGTMSFPSPAGDLSGDGLDDVLAFDIKLPQEVVEIRAFRGTDGVRLWQRRLDDAADVSVLPVSDLTADGIDDLILLGLDVEQESETYDCPYEGPQDHCRIDYEAEYTWLTGVLDGTNGRLEWSRTYPAAVDYRLRYEETGNAATGEVRYEESLTSSNLSIWPMVAGDHDGDGANDIVLEAIDLDYEIEIESRETVVVYEDEGSFEMNSATRALLVRGLDGADLLSRSSERGPTIAILEPVGDVVGGPRPDLLWHDTTYTNDTFSCIGVAVVDHCSDELDETMRFAVEAIDGDTLEPVWGSETSGVDDTFAFPLGEDVSGDGKEDIAQLTVSWEGPTFTTRLLSGRDGSQLWIRAGSRDLEFPILVEDLGAGPGTDVLLSSFLESTEPISGDTEFRLRLRRVEGATGNVLFETTRPLGAYPGDANGVGFYLYLGAMPDADGDGTGDVYGGGVVETFEIEDDGDFVMTDADATAFVESGRVDAILLQRDAEIPMTFEGLPDLDGDARADVFEWHWPADPFADDPLFELFARRATPGDPLWSRSFVGDQFWLGTLWTAGDHDGHAGEELLYGDNSRQSGAWRSVVGSLRGADGTARWLKGGDD